MYKAIPNIMPIYTNNYQTPRSLTHENHDQ